MRALPVLVVGVLLLVPPALAHANYFSSEPPRGARLSVPPDHVVVTLSEDVDPGGSGLEVRDQEGRRVDRGQTQVETGQTPKLTIQLSDVGPGAYTVTWRALSSVDGHVTSGSFGFAVGSYEPPKTEDATFRWDFASAAARFLLYAGFALGFGALAFAWWIEPRPTSVGRRRFFTRCIAAGALLQVAGMIVLLVSTWNQAGLPALAFIQGTSVGRGLALRLAAAALLLAASRLALARPGPFTWTLAPLLVLSSLGSSRFAHAAQKGLWAAAVDWVHLVSAATWLGGLGIFLLLLWKAEAHGTLQTVHRTGLRFSRVALTAVVLLGSTGLIATFTILGWGLWRDPLVPIRHPYGLILAGKVAAFGGMLLLASVNRFVFLGDRRDGETVKHVPFRRMVATEACLGAAILVLAGFLTSISPPSASAAASDVGGLSVARDGENFNVTLRINPWPAVGGASNVSLELREVASGRSLESAYRVRLTIASSDDPSLGAQSWVVNQTGPGKWVQENVLFTTAGNYTATVTIQTETVYSEDVTLPFLVRERAE